MCNVKKEKQRAFGGCVPLNLKLHLTILIRLEKLCKIYSFFIDVSMGLMGEATCESRFLPVGRR
jgi:hypothetical protein